MFVPLHLRPSPVYPGLHAQTCDPCVLLQEAFTWHLPGYVLHSSISVTKKKKRKEWEIGVCCYSRVKREKEQKICCNLLVSCGSRVGPVSRPVFCKFLHVGITCTTWSIRRKLLFLFCHGKTKRYINNERKNEQPDKETDQIRITYYSNQVSNNFWDYWLYMYNSFHLQYI